MSELGCKQAAGDRRLPKTRLRSPAKRRERTSTCENICARVCSSSAWIWGLRGKRFEHEDEETPNAFDVYNRSYFEVLSKTVLVRLVDWSYAETFWRGLHLFREGGLHLILLVCFIPYVVCPKLGEYMPVLHSASLHHFPSKWR